MLLRDGDFNCIGLRFGIVSCPLHRDLNGRFIVSTDHIHAFDQ